MHEVRRLPGGKSNMLTGERLKKDSKEKKANPAALTLGRKKCTLS